MKKGEVIRFSVLSIVLLFCFAHCKKENVPLNITLYNKPLKTIQASIQGKWQLRYEKGGICSTCSHQVSNFYWTLSANNRIKESFNGIIVADTTINWVKDLGTYTNGDSTYILRCYDKQNVPWNYVVDRIYNDTLILHDNSADAVFYHFTKI